MSQRDDEVLEVLRSGKAGGSGWTRGKCPFCLERTGKEDRRGAFGVHGDTGWYSCFKCGAKGRLKYNDAAASLGDAWAQHPPPETMRLPPDYHPLFVEGGAVRSLALRPALDYVLRARRLPKATAAAAGIGACVTGKLSGRVIVPIPAGEDMFVGHGSVLGWVARSWGPSSTPYLYPPGMARGEVLYNHWALRVETPRPVYVVEGVFDALAHWPNAVALLGKPSQAQVDTLSVSRRPVVVVLDGDAVDECWALMMRLRLIGCRAGGIRLPPRVDPDEISRDVLDAAAAKSLTSPALVRI